MEEAEKEESNGVKYSGRREAEGRKGDSVKNRRPEKRRKGEGLSSPPFSLLLLRLDRDCAIALTPSAPSLLLPMGPLETGWDENGGGKGGSVSPVRCGGTLSKGCVCGGRGSLGRLRFQENGRGEKFW